MTVLYRGGRVRTPADRDATALLVDGDVVAWVGSEAAADALDASEVVHLDGAWVAPAFVDAHVHTTSTGLALTGVDLHAARSLAEALDLVAAAARPGQVLLGTGWDDTRWPERRPPTAEELDRAAGGGAVYVSRTDVHSAVCSTALLEQVPSARALPGWAGGGLVRQDAHLALRMAAYAAVAPAQREAAQVAALQRAAELGIASVHECGGPGINGEDDFTALLALGRRGDLPEVVGLWGELGGVERARALGARTCGGDLLLDGSIGSRTACLREAYADGDSAPAGTPYVSRDDLVDHLVACAQAGFPTGFHAIGDGALDLLLLECLPAAEAQVGVEALRTLRNRVEHAEVLHPEHVDAMARYGMVASVQPAFDARWGGPNDLYTTRLGVERALPMNPYAALAAAGVALALSSDAPVTPLDPWGAVRAAVRHRTPGSGLSARAAFAAHSRGGWRSVHDDESGDLVPGAPATFAVWQVEGDLVVQAPDERVAGWSTDPRSGVSGLPDLDAPDPVCALTVLRGRTVFERG